MGCALGRDIRSVGWGLLGIMPLGIVQVYVAGKVVQYQGVLHPTGIWFRSLGSDYQEMV